MATAAGLVVLAGGSVGADEPRTEVEVVIDAPTWEVSWERCDQVPDGVVITGEGNRYTSIETTTRPDGTALKVAKGVAFGTATDQDGNEYTWFYDNVERAASSRADTGTYHGTMVDRFELHGGPHAYENGFEAVVVDDFTGAVFTATPITVDGDPFDFTKMEGKCDPI